MRVQYRSVRADDSLPWSDVDKLTRLIAIMLGRFRMTVVDCLHEYEQLGKEVFGKPRTLTELNTFVIRRTKYKAKNLKKVFEDVAARRNELLPDTENCKITFPSRRGLCKT